MEIRHKMLFLASNIYKYVYINGPLYYNNNNNNNAYCDSTWTNNTFGQSLHHNLLGQKNSVSVCFKETIHFLCQGVSEKSLKIKQMGSKRVLRVLADV